METGFPSGIFRAPSIENPWTGLSSGVVRGHARETRCGPKQRLSRSAVSGFSMARRWCAICAVASAYAVPLFVGFGELASVEPAENLTDFNSPLLCGDISGRVVFEGEIPDRRLVVRMSNPRVDGFCCSDDIVSNELIVNPDDRGVMHVFVYLRSEVHSVRTLRSIASLSGHRSGSKLRVVSSSRTRRLFVPDSQLRWRRWMRLHMPSARSQP